jgi:hypothetical protein
MLGFELCLEPGLSGAGDGRLEDVWPGCLVRMILHSGHDKAVTGWMSRRGLD